LLHLETESPGFVSVALNLYNSSSNPVQSPPLDHIDSVRAWKSSHISPFLGHISLEALSCSAPSDVPSPSAPASAWWNWLVGHKTPGNTDEQKEATHVRVMVNGKAEKMGGCEGGPGGACEFKEFQDFVDQRYKKWSAFDQVCEKKIE
jgi:acid phosphatase